MWCIGRLTAEYRDRMYALLDLYAQPYNAKEPVVCVDEKSSSEIDREYEWCMHDRVEIISSEGRQHDG